MWYGNKYTDEKEPFIEVILCGFPTEKDDVESLVELLFMTKTKINNLSIPQLSEPLREHTETDGSNYIIVKNGFHKIFSRKNTMLNTLSGMNELRQIPSDSSKVWVLGAEIKK